MAGLRMSVVVCATAFLLGESSVLFHVSMSDLPMEFNCCAGRSPLHTLDSGLTDPLEVTFDAE